MSLKIEASRRWRSLAFAERAKMRREEELATREVAEKKRSEEKLGAVSISISDMPKGSEQLILELIEAGDEEHGPSSGRRIGWLWFSPTSGLWGNYLYSDWMEISMPTLMFILRHRGCGN